MYVIQKFNGILLIHAKYEHYVIFISEMSFIHIKILENYISLNIKVNSKTYSPELWFYLIFVGINFRGFSEKDTFKDKSIILSIPYDVRYYTSINI